MPGSHRVAPEVRAVLPRGFMRRLALIAAAGLVLRVLCVAFLGPGNEGPLPGDVAYFHVIANLLADGAGYVNPRAVAEGIPGIPSAEHPPLWPLLLAGASELGFTGPVSHRLVGCPVGAAVIVLVGLLGRRVGGEPVGLVAAGATALFPSFIAADGSLMSETLYGGLVGAVLLAALRLRDRPSLPRAAVVGAAIGLAALTRAEAVALLAILVLPLVLRLEPGRRLAIGAVALGTVLVVLAPWAIRNTTTFDRPVLVSTNDGSAILGANCDLTYGGRQVGFWTPACFQPVSSANEGIQAARWRSDGLRYAADHPVRLLGVVVPVRLLRTLGVWAPLRDDNVPEGRVEAVSRAGQAVYYLLLLPLGAVGAVMLRRSGQGGTLLVLLAPLILMLLVTIATYGYARFRHVGELALVVLASYAMVELSRRRGSARAPRRASAPCAPRIKATRG